MSETTVKADRGTDVILHLKADEREFLNDWTLRETITKFSDHISTPVYLYEAPKDDEKKEDDKKEASSPEDVWHQSMTPRPFGRSRPRTSRTKNTRPSTRT